MSILLQHLKLYDTNQKSNAKVLQSKDASLVQSITRGLERAFLEGEVLKGEIIDLRSTEAIIKLMDGSTLQGEIHQDVDLFIGQKAMFQVSKNPDKSYVLKLVPTLSNPLNDLAKKALNQAGIPSTERNKNAVLALLDANLSVDKKSIMDLLKVSYQYPDADIENIVYLNKHRIPIDENNLNMMKSYQNSEHRIVQEISNLATSLSKLVGMEDETISTKIQNLFDLALSQAGNKQAEEMSGKFQQAETNSLPTGVQLSSYLTGQQREELISLIQSSGFSDDIVSQLEAENLTDTELLKAVQQFLSKDSTDLTLSSHFKEFLQNDIFQRVFQQVMLRNYTLKPNEISKKNLEKLYDKMEEDMNFIQEFFKNSQLKEDTGSVTNQVQHLKNNIDFMKTLGGIFPYVQLPIHLKEQKVHGELYVFNRRKGKENNQENCKILLHLDMENLGALDIHVNLHGKHLDTKFYVIDDEVKTMFMETIEELNHQLQDKGYITTSEFYKQDTKKNTIDEFRLREQEEEGMQMKRYTFDIRA